MRLCAVRRAMVPVGFLALLVTAASGQESTTATDRARFELFNACRPVDLNALLINAGGSGYSSEPATRLRALVERRLRIARLDGEGRTASRWRWGLLVVNYHSAGFDVDVSDPANFSKASLRIEAYVRYSKRVTDDFGNSGLASTWISERTISLPVVLARAHQDVEDAIYSAGERAVSGLVDEFIDEYLRINGEACGSPVEEQP